MKTENEIGLCRICKKKFKLKRKGMVLCSRECVLENNRRRNKKVYKELLKNKPKIKRYCIVCGKECPPKFLKFCSSACRCKDFREKHPKYYENERKIQSAKYSNNERVQLDGRIKAKTKYKYSKAECQLCHSQKELEFHHYSIPYHKDRFLVLCNKCHDKVHYSPLTKDELNKIYLLIKLREQNYVK